MPTFPGQRARPGVAVGVVAVVFSLALGLASGWALFHGRTASERLTTICTANRQDQTVEARAAACLLNAYLALVNEPATSRDAKLASIVLPARLAEERSTYRGLGSAPVNPPGKPVQYVDVVAEYATVVAVRPGTTTDPGAYRSPDVGFSAWVSIVDSYSGQSAPLANWYLGHFAVRWQANRWWLTDRFHADENATPMTYTQGREDRAFGSGWIGV